MGPVDARTERRAPWNEDLARETNEALERGISRADLDRLVRYRCECADITCGEAVQATLREYDKVRQSPRRFLVVAGHVMPEIETVVETTPRYLVVEKEGTAGEVAEASDPRD
jgi:hypothetical protein